MIVTHPRTDHLTVSGFSTIRNYYPIPLDFYSNTPEVIHACRSDMAALGQMDLLYLCPVLVALYQSVLQAIRQFAKGDALEHQYLKMREEIWGRPVLMLIIALLPWTGPPSIATQHADYLNGGAIGDTKRCDAFALTEDSACECLAEG
ncbi:hypothetical protein EVJ58_g2691 [Rhodofomes roseus]|uniref:Uncharacterized protein n=1 Tax=Rhodofomes roseus TaxID=34475 RepID=A0A4Y9YRB0_9APHY|nr:hypothetical protein EVJ58_g2691 [Rhodofomes roseus]